MARKHVVVSEPNGAEWTLCGRKILPTKASDLRCLSCLDIQAVMSACEAGKKVAGLEATVHPHGSNGARVETDTSSPEFRRFAYAMRQGVSYGTDRPTFKYSVRDKTEKDAVVRHMAA